MKFHVLLRGKEFPERAIVRRLTGSGTWNLNVAFPEREYAIEAAEQWLKDHPSDHLDVTEGKDRNVVWCSGSDYASKVPPTVPHITTERKQMHTDLDKPLNIKREGLIERLQENLDAEVKERELLEAKERAARLSVTQFVTDHEDEIIQWIGGGGAGFGSGSWEEIAKNMERFFEDNNFKPKSAKKSHRENDLEKFVRVLGMATDDTVEVKPNQPIYELL